MKNVISVVLVSLIFLASSSAIIAYAAQTPPLPGAPTYDISVEEAHKMLVNNPAQYLLLDVRTEEEYHAEHIDMPNVELKNIPKDVLGNRIDELDESKTIIVYCQSGVRSRTASETLAQHGFFVYNMRGGINAWKQQITTSTSTPAEPTVSPVHTAAAAASPAPTAMPMPVGKKRVQGFEVIFALAAISLIAWRRVLKNQ
ncbi:MAG: rhodanese-like domain-containing protein [Halobacteriota archaeon]